MARVVRSVVLVGVLVAMAVSVAPAASAGGVHPGTGTVTVTPNTGLIDEQVVTLHGEDLEQDTVMQVAECRAPADADNCREDYGLGFDLARTGSFTSQVRLEAAFGLQDGSSVDCRAAAGTCVLSVVLLEFIGSDTPTGAAVYDVPLDFDANAPLAPAPTLTLSPASGLLDRHVVEVTGAGFDPTGSADGDAIGQVWFAECTTTTYSFETCSGTNLEDTNATTDAAGAFTHPLRLKAVLRKTDTDCRTSTCYLLAIEAPDGDQAATPLLFDPDAALWDGRLRLDVSPSTGLVDGQVVGVDVAGFYPGQQLRVRQCGRERVHGGVPRCEGSIQLTAAADGTAHADLAVQERYAGPGSHRSDVDCAVWHCFVETTRGFHDVEAPIAFADAASGAPVASPTVVTPSFTG